MKALHMVAYILLIIGGLNWGLTAFNFNVVEKIFGKWPSVVMVIYLLVGISALVEVFTHKSNCKACDVKTPTAI